MGENGQKHFEKQNYMQRMRDSLLYNQRYYIATIIKPYFAGIERK